MKYINLYCPLAIEHLWDIIAEVLDEKNLSHDKSNKEELKREVLEIIFKLLKDDVIYVGDVWVNPSTLKRWNLSSEAAVAKIQEMWFKKAEYPDFFDMVWFGSSDWYVKKTKELGLAITTNWKTFVEEKIGNLEEWIELNKPK